ncbi:DUF1684 domain-containing protein [bacterium]|nr:MAG: DUF1684 domain-containing protein [bacterium]
MELQLKFKSINIAFIILGLIAISCSNNDPNTKYKNEIKKYREEVKSFFINSSDSPTVDMEKKIIPFYYEANPEYKLEAYLEQYKVQDTLEMLTTQSDVRKMIRYGKLSFVLNNHKYALTAYINIEHPESLFVPFHDQTNKEETYEAGRYLEIERTKEKKYTLDFNLAYNPYCYYNAKYSCPIVPEENILNTKIEAGEKANNDIH